MLEKRNSTSVDRMNNSWNVRDYDARLFPALMFSSQIHFEDENLDQAIMIGSHTADIKLTSGLATCHDQLADQ